MGGLPLNFNDMSSREVNTRLAWQKHVRPENPGALVLKPWCLGLGA